MSCSPFHGSLTFEGTSGHEMERRVLMGLCAMLLRKAIQQRDILGSKLFFPRCEIKLAFEHGYF